MSLKRVIFCDLNVTQCDNLHFRCKLLSGPQAVQAQTEEDYPYNWIETIDSKYAEFKGANKVCKSI